jgi:RNA polymerase sigma-70 factor (ECF subfamily)
VDGAGSRRSDETGDPRADEQLLADHRHGDPTAFPLLVFRYQRELYHFLVRFLGDRASAEDVFQEAFLQVHQSADQFDVERRFKPWLFTIAANKARDLLRSNSRKSMSPLQASISQNDEDSGEFMSLMAMSQETPDQPLEKQELREKVQGVVMSMPGNLREILLLSYFHQFSYKHISDILGIPLGTVKSRLHAAVASFATRWKASNPASPSS